MSFDDLFGIAEAVLLAAGLDPPRALALARGVALAQRASLDGVPVGRIKADARRFAGFGMPDERPPLPGEVELPDTLPLAKAGRKAGP